MNNVTESLIHELAEDAYLRYSMSVITDRALINVRDGQKPVHLRILYAMRLLGLTGKVKPVKSARVVGDVIGKYHPHGDAAVYESMVRMAQPFSMRYPIVDGQGNFGTRDGDSAAAQRYTEAKLLPISELLLSELDQGTVDYIDNYDGSFKEPEILPARLPFGLMNGTMGIAVAVASVIPSHNIRELANASISIIENKSITEDEALEHILGPDYPGGGQIITSREDMLQVYKTGRGPIITRGIWHKEDLARGQWKIVITQLPYLVSTKSIIENLDAIVNPKNKDNKPLTSKQIQDRAQALELIDSVDDESDEKNEIRLVIYPRSSKVDSARLMAFLYANTGIEDTLNVNMTILDLEGFPKVLSLFDQLSEWCSFRIATVLRRTKWELSKCQARIHILEGRVIAFNNIDLVIKIVREAEDPVKDLSEKLGLSEIQANDVVELKLRQLSKLEDSKLSAEISKLSKEEAALLKLIASDKLLRALVVKEIKSDVDVHGDDRRSIIKPEESAKSLIAKIAPVDLKEDNVTITVSQHMWIKAYKGHEVDDSSVSLNPGDSLMAKIKSTSAKSISLVDNNGRIYSISNVSVPFKGDGAPVSTLIFPPNNGKIIMAMDTNNSEDSYLFATSAGFGFKAPASSLSTRQKSGKAFAVVPDGGKLFNPLLISDSSKYIVILTNENYLSIFAIDEIKSLVNGGQGVQLMDLKDNDFISDIEIIESLDTPIKIAKFEIKVKDISKFVTKRARRGKLIK